MVGWNKVGPRDLGVIFTPRDRQYLRLFIQYFTFTGDFRNLRDVAAIPQTTFH